MAEFKEAYLLTLQNEGKYSNIAGDAGGETYKGIARNEHPHWFGWSFIDACKDANGHPQGLETNKALQDAVAVFYKTDFWNIIQGDKISSQYIADKLFDTTVNIGIKPAVKIMQQAAGVPLTGSIDATTLNAFNA